MNIEENPFDADEEMIDEEMAKDFMPEAQEMSSSNQNIAIEKNEKNGFPSKPD